MAASSALEKAFTEYGEGLSSGAAVEAADLLAATKQMSATLDEAGATITNEEVSVACSALLTDVAAMIKTAEEQVEAKTVNGQVSDELNDTLEAQTTALNDDVDALTAVCGA